MAGSDLPSPYGGSPPPGTPARRPLKRKRRDGDDSEGPEPPSLPSRETRSSAAAREAMADSMRMARSVAWAMRRAAAGALWTARTGRGRDLGLGVEQMREVILGVRAARSVDVPVDINYSLFVKECVGIGAKHQASVPEWKNVPSKEEAADYRAATFTKQGTIVCPLNTDISATNKPEKMRRKQVDKCNCSRPGSEKCVRDHVTRARVWIKEQLGAQTFEDCGLDAMGEQVGELWTEADKKKLEDVGKSIPQNKYRNFMKTPLKEFSPKTTKDLAKYYYNVFLPRRLARLTRSEQKKNEAVDTADKNSEHRPRKKRKSSGSSASTRCKNKKDLKSGPAVRAQRKKN